MACSNDGWRDQSCAAGINKLHQGHAIPSPVPYQAICAPASAVCVLLPTLLPGVRVSLRAGQCLCSSALQLVRPSLSFNINSRVLPLLA